MARCEVCFHRCEIPEGGRGLCGARTCADGRVIPENYGRVTALALDPIEKKPLRRFHPGGMVLSVGSYGCNLRCPFCQNHEISWSAEAMSYAERADKVTPEALVRTAVRLKGEGNIGIAFTYNEPLIGWEFVRDTARLAHEAGLASVLVTNGTARLAVLEAIAPWIDAMALEKRMAERELPGLHFRAVYFTPTFSKYAGELCAGVQMHLTDRGKASAVEGALTLLDGIRDLYPDQLSFLPSGEGYFIDKLLGTDAYRLGRFDAQGLLEAHREKREAFLTERRPFLLYE